MLCLIKSGYAPLTFEEGCELENYAYCYGVDRARWTRPFTRGPEATRAEALRVRLMEPLLRARAALVAARDATASLTAAFGTYTPMTR